MASQLESFRSARNLILMNDQQFDANNNVTTQNSLSPSEETFDKAHTGLSRSQNSKYTRHCKINDIHEAKEQKLSKNKSREALALLREPSIHGPVYFPRATTPPEISTWKVLLQQNASSTVIPAKRFKLDPKDDNAMMITTPVVPRSWDELDHMQKAFKRGQAPTTATIPTIINPSNVVSSKSSSSKRKSPTSRSNNMSSSSQQNKSSSKNVNNRSVFSTVEAYLNSAKTSEIVEMLSHISNNSMVNRNDIVIDSQAKTSSNCACAYMQRVDLPEWVIMSKKELKLYFDDKIKNYHHDGEEEEEDLSEEAILNRHKKYESTEKRHERYERSRLQEEHLRKMYEKKKVGKLQDAVINRSSSMKLDGTLPSYSTSGPSTTNRQRSSYILTPNPTNTFGTKPYLQISSSTSSPFKTFKIPKSIQYWPCDLNIKSMIVTPHRQLGVFHTKLDNSIKWENFQLDLHGKEIVEPKIQSEQDEKPKERKASSPVSGRTRKSNLRYAPQYYK